MHRTQGACPRHDGLSPPEPAIKIFKNLFFVLGYLIAPRVVDDPDGDSFAQGYGNQIASAKAFPPLGNARTARPAIGDDLCPTGACG